MINNEYYSAIRLDIAQLLPMKYTNVLEIGCGEGGFATTLQRPCEVWGIEPVEAAARLAQQRMDKVLKWRAVRSHADVPPSLQQGGEEPVGRVSAAEPQNVLVTALISFSGVARGGCTQCALATRKAASA